MRADPAASSPESAAGVGFPGPYRLLLVASLCSLLAPLNSTMLAVALPAIRTDFGVGHAAVGWLVSSYLIAMAVVQPIGGRLGDDVGRARVLRVGLVAFLACSVAAAVAPTFLLLVVFRTLQAISGAILIPNAMGLLRTGIAERQFGTFSGLNSAVIGATAAAGPVLGGVLLVIGPWRSLFLVNIPIVCVALAFSVLLPRDRVASSYLRNVDWVGLGLFVLILSLVTLLLSSARAWPPVVVLGATVSLVILGLGFLIQQRRTQFPTAAWTLFRRRVFAAAATHILLMNLAMYTTLLAVPFFLVDVQGRSASTAGLMLASMAILQALAAPLAGRASDSVGRQIPTVAGSVLVLVAAVMLLAGVNAEVQLVYLAVAVAVLGLGVGVSFVTATVAAIESAPKALAGSAAGTQSMMRYAGSIAGTGMLAGLLGPDDIAGVSTFRVLFGVLAVIAALSLVAAWNVRPSKT